MPTMSFPNFDRSNPKLWKQQCETYFEFYSVPVEMWVRVSTMHFVLDLLWAWPIY
jgi:hypothetical protein